MLEQQQQRNQQHQDVPQPAQAEQAHDAQVSAPATAGQAPAQAVPQPASFAEMTGQQRQAAEPGQQVAQPAAPGQEAPLTNQDALIEQLSHGMVAKDLDDKDQAFLKTNGYRALPIIRGVNEFVMRTFLPLEGSGKAPIVAFRGTVPSKGKTIIADLDPTGIGMYQFNPNRAMIDAQTQAAAAAGPIISTGHSLGGALAQIMAATFPDRVGRIVTFQSPGVSKAMAKSLQDYNEQHPDHEIESTHHRVEGDLVPQGGQALTPGVVVNHKMTGGSALSRNPLSKHVSMPLAQEEIQAGHDVPEHTDGHGSVETSVQPTSQVNADKSQVIENIRTGIGHLIYGVGRIQP